MRADVQEEWAHGAQEWTGASFCNYDSKPIPKSPICSWLLLLPGEHTLYFVALTTPHSLGLN